jgi:transposase
MKKQLNPKRALRTQRVFSEELKRQTVKDIESGVVSVSKAALELGSTTTSIYRWIYQYSRYLKRGKILVVEEQSESYKSKELEQRIRDLEAALGRKQMELDILSKVIELANEEFQTDLKKNLLNQSYSGSDPQKGKSTDTK